MPKQIITDAFGELLETGKKTGQQLVKLPGEMLEDAAHQTGVKPSAEEEKQEEAKIQKIRQEEEKNKAKDIAFVKKQLAEFQKSPLSKPTVQEEKVMARKEEMAVLASGKKKELPAPVLAVKRKSQRVEVKGGVGG